LCQASDATLQTVNVHRHGRHGAAGIHRVLTTQGKSGMLWHRSVKAFGLPESCDRPFFAPEVVRLPTAIAEPPVKRRFFPVLQ